MSAVTCAHCGASFSGKRRTAKYCSTKCRKDANNARRRTTQPASEHEAQAAEVADLRGQGLMESVRAELTSLNKLGTTLGAQALAVAEQMAAGGETGSAMAALSRELRSIMVLASRGGESADSVDELKKKRDEKRAAAAQSG